MAGSVLTEDASQSTPGLDDPWGDRARQQRSGASARSLGHVTLVEQPVGAGHVDVDALVKPVRPAEHDTADQRTQAGDLGPARRLAIRVPVLACASSRTVMPAGLSASNAMISPWRRCRRC